MPIAGKYYMNYGAEFLPPRELGRKNAERLRKHHSQVVPREPEHTRNPFTTVDTLVSELLAAAERSRVAQAARENPAGDEVGRR